MAILSITVPDAVAPRVLNAIATKYGYQATINGSPNPQSKTEFVRQWIISLVKAAVKEQEANTAAATAFNTSSLDVDNNISIT